MPRKIEVMPPTCRLCGGLVVTEPGKYMVVFGWGKGPQHGAKYYLCEDCGNGVI